MNQQKIDPTIAALSSFYLWPFKGLPPDAWNAALERVKADWLSEDNAERRRSGKDYNAAVREDLAWNRNKVLVVHIVFAVGMSLIGLLIARLISYVGISADIANIIGNLFQIVAALLLIYGIASHAACIYYIKKYNISTQSR